MDKDITKLNFDNPTKGAVELKNALEDIQKVTQGKLTPAMDHLGDRIGNVFATAARDGKITADEIGKAFMGMAKNILEQQVFSKLGPFGSILSGLLGGLAGGGSIQPNKPTLVGERGPELFIPNSGGRIANNHDAGGMFGGNPVTVNQTINIEPSTQKDLVAMIHAARPMMREDAKRAVMSALSGVRY